MVMPSGTIIHRNSATTEGATASLPTMPRLLRRHGFKASRSWIRWRDVPA